MLAAYTKTIKKNSNDWLHGSALNHAVSFYQGEDTLLATLQDYIGAGIANGETCVVIATPEHLKRLEKLITTGRGHYITFDASRTLRKFMRGGMPDETLFADTVGTLVAEAAVFGAPVRAFGEMVALLWKAGNAEATYALEELWNKLAQKHDFTLLCAYPELHFCMHSNEQQQIREQHTLQNISQK